MDAPQGGVHFFPGAAGTSAHDISIVNAGGDIHQYVYYNNYLKSAPINIVTASIEEVTVWLNGANFREIYRLSLEARMDDTGTWLIATFEFGEFLRKKGTVVWATGLPGSGKTILASITIEHLEKTFSGRTDIAVIYAFLRFSEKLTLLEIIAGLLSQLVRSYPNVLAHVLLVYQQAKKFQDKLSCTEAVNILKGTLDLFSDAFIVIDGLDEVNDATKDGLLGILTSLQAHILFTCRPLEYLYMHRRDQDLHISVQAQTRDIDIYVAKRIKERAKLAAILSANPTVAERFLLARLQMELVLEKCTTLKSVFEALETLPSGVNDMHQATMERINSQSEAEVSIAQRTFLWLLHAREDLSPTFLTHALSFSFRDKVFHEESSVSIPMLLSTCCGLVTVEDSGLGQGPVVRFIHHSTQEFMKTVEFSQLPDPHNLLVVTSVACMDTYWETIVAEAAPNSIFRLDLQLYTEREHLPLLQYALAHWGHHAKICDDQKALSPLIPSFLSKFDVYALLEAASSKIYYGGIVSSGLHLAAAYDLANLISSKRLRYLPVDQTKTPFHVAAERGHIASLDALLKCYSGVHVRDGAGETPLHVAHNSAVAQILLGLTPSDTWRANPAELLDINAHNRYEQSALFKACNIRGAPDERTRRLIGAFASHPGIDPNLVCSRGNTHLLRFCRDRSQDAAKLLISSFPNLEFHTENRKGQTPLGQACESRSAFLVDQILSRNPGTVHHQENRNGQTALERLLERSAYNMYPTGEEGQIIGLLTMYGGTIRMLQAARGSLPIYLPMSAVGDERSKSQVIFVSLDDRHRYENGRTSLMLMANVPRALKYLISKFGDRADWVNAQDNYGRSALMHACFDGQGQTSIEVLVLFCSSVDIHLRDRQGISALEYAMSSGMFEAIEILLNHESWNPLSIRKAIIAATQKQVISASPLALCKLLATQRVQNALSELQMLDRGDRRDIIGLMAMLHRRTDCQDLAVINIGERVLWDPSRDLLQNAVAWLVGDLESDTPLAQFARLSSSIPKEPAAIRKFTIYALNCTTLPLEALDLHFIQEHVRTSFIWDVHVRHPDTAILINCLYRRRDGFELFQILYNGAFGCERL